jgi:uncharacterized protein YheU (UPF0270 family)
LPHRQAWIKTSHAPDDPLEEAEAKSKSVDERIPTVIAREGEDLGPGEEVLQEESEAVRQQPRP